MKNNKIIIFFRKFCFLKHIKHWKNRYLINIHYWLQHLKQTLDKNIKYLYYIPIQYVGTYTIYYSASDS